MFLTVTAVNNLAQKHLAENILFMVKEKDREYGIKLRLILCHVTHTHISSAFKPLFK